MAKRKTSRWASEAAQSALVRFGPEESGLRELASTIQQTLQGDVSAARGGTAALINAINETTPAIQGVYDKAGLDQAAIASGLRADTAGLGDVARTVKAGIALEQANAADNIVRQRTAALTDLGTRKVSAVAGQNFQIQRARQQFATDMSKVLQRKIDLAREKGAYTAQQQSTLEDQQRERQLRIDLENAGNQQSERNSLRSAGFDPDTGKPLAGGKADPRIIAGKGGGRSGTGEKLNPAGAHATARQKIATGLSQLAKLDPGKHDRHGIAPGLVEGAPAQKGDTVYEKDATGKYVPKIDPKTGTQVTTGDLPAEPSLGEWATIAADIYYDGHLSRANQIALQNNGYSLKKLGLLRYTYGRYRRAHPPSRPSTSNYYGGAGAGSGVRR